jgi:hypothetical protein
MTTCTDTRAELANLCHTIAEATWKRYMRYSPPLYLFGFKGQPGVYTELQVAHDKPSYHEMVVYVMLPRNMTAYQLTRWLEPWLSNAPLYWHDELAKFVD